MAPLLNAFTRGELRNLFTGPRGPEAAVSGQGVIIGIGKHDVKCVKASAQASALALTDSYVQELTKKIRHEVIDEVEVKLNQKVYDEVDAKVNQKVPDNLTLVLKKLVEANPTLNVNIGEIRATISSDTGGDGTPMTEGPSS